MPHRTGPFVRVSDNPDKKPGGSTKRKAIRTNGLKEPDSAGQLRINATGARRTVVVCPYRADDCPAPNLVPQGWFP